MTTTKNILIFGATGLVGEHIADAIVASKAEFGKISVFTSPETLSKKSNRIDQLKKEGVEIITGDITSASDIYEAYNGKDTIVSAVGRPVIQIQLQLIELAEKHPDVKRFFPSEYGTDVEYWPSSAHEKPHQQKLKVRAMLKDVKDLEYTYVVVGPFGDAADSLYLSAKDNQSNPEASFNVKRKRAVLLGDGNGKVSLTTMRDVGKLVVAALLQPEVSRNKALHVNSFTSTPNEILAEFEKQTGGQKWEVSYTSLERLKEVEQEAYEKGNPRAAPLTLMRIWTSGGTLYDKRDNHLIGMEDSVDTLESAVRQAIEVQGMQS